MLRVLPGTGGWCLSAHHWWREAALAGSRKSVYLLISFLFPIFSVHSMGPKRTGSGIAGKVGDQYCGQLVNGLRSHSKVQLEPGIYGLQSPSLTTTKESREGWGWGWNHRWIVGIYPLFHERCHSLWILDSSPTLWKKKLFLLKPPWVSKRRIKYDRLSEFLFQVRSLTFKKFVNERHLQLTAAWYHTWQPLLMSQL